MNNKFNRKIKASAEDRVGEVIDRILINSDPLSHMV